MKTLLPVQPNFAKLFAFIILGAFSSASLAEHHASAEKKMDDMKQKDTIERIKADNTLTEEEKKVMIKKEKRLNEMEKLMKEEKMEKAPE